MGQDLLLHVVVAVLELQHRGAFAVLFIDGGGSGGHRGLAGLEFLHVVVADDVLQLRFAHRAAHLAQVVEALGALGVLRALIGGQHGVQLHGDVLGVLHQVLCAAGMHREAVDGDEGRGRVEVLVFQLAHIAAVHRVGIVGAEALDVEQVGALAHLLVGGEGHADLAVGDVLLLQPLHGGEDLGDAGLVVRAQQGGSVGGDEGLALPVRQFGELGHTHVLAGTGEQNVAAVVVLDDLGLHVLARGVGGGVHVGDEADGGFILQAGGGGQHAVDIAVFVHPHLLKAQFLHLPFQQTGQVELAGGAGVRGAVVVGGGVNFRIIKETLISAHGLRPPYFLSLLVL